MSSKYGKLLSVIFACLVICSLLSSSLIVPVHAGDQESDGTAANNVYIPLAASNDGTVAAQQGQSDQIAPEEQVVNAASVYTAKTAVMAAPAAAAALPWTNLAPVLTNEQLAQAEAAVAHTHLAGPAIKATGLAPLAAQALANSESTVSVSLEQSAVEPSIGPHAPSDPQLYRNVAPVTTSGTKSTVLEASVAEGGKYAFYTGNWFAARSTNGGASWTYINPYSDMSDFCCDQVTLYDEARDMILWYRQGVANASGVNRFRLGISTDGGATFCNYDVSPTNTNSAWTGQWWDYPHLQLGANFVYIASNMFNAAGSGTRTVMLRFPLDSLRSCAGFNYNYYADPNWFTFVPVQGADHIMYFASNWPNTAPQNSRLNIWQWSENSTSLTSVTKTVAAWSTGAATCGSTTGNWAARSDMRLLTGARYMIHGNNAQTPGRKVIGWWWNVGQGGSFARPYIEAAAFYEDTLAQVSGAQGRPYVWNSSICFLFPSAAANKRGDLGLVLNEGTGTNLNPSVDFGIADDYVGVPPGWSLSRVQTSNARPSNNGWGDYNTVRPFYPSNDAWIGGAHYIASTTNCSNCGVPIFFVFGRSRDYYSWARWQGN
ncbi:MAG: hypothetical protein U0350_37890 [Caldilineaceae bacterium]